MNKSFDFDSIANATHKSERKVDRSGKIREYSQLKSFKNIQIETEILQTMANGTTDLKNFLSNTMLDEEGNRRYVSVKRNLKKIADNCI